MKQRAIAGILQAADDGDIKGVDRAISASRDAINFRDPDTGLTALHIAAGDGNLAMTLHLLRKPGIDLTIKDYFGRDAVDLAMGVNATEIVDAISKKLYPKSFGLAARKPGPSPS